MLPPQASEPPMPLFRLWNDISLELNYQSAGFSAKTRSGDSLAKSREWLGLQVRRPGRKGATPPYGFPSELLNGSTGDCRGSLYRGTVLIARCCCYIGNFFSILYLFATFAIGEGKARKLCLRYRCRRSDSGSQEFEQCRLTIRGSS